MAATGDEAVKLSQLKTALDANTIESAIKTPSDLGYTGVSINTLSIYDEDGTENTFDTINYEQESDNLIEQIYAVPTTISHIYTILNGLAGAVLLSMCKTDEATLSQGASNYIHIEGYFSRMESNLIYGMKPIMISGMNASGAAMERCGFGTLEFTGTTFTINGILVGLTRAYTYGFVIY